MQKYIRENKKEKHPIESPYSGVPGNLMDKVIESVVRSITDKMNIKKGEDGRSMTDEEIIEILNPHLERTKKEIGENFIENLERERIRVRVPVPQAR